MTYATVTGTAAYNRAKYKPHDKHLVRIARNSHNAEATNLANGVIVNMIEIPANSLLLGCWVTITVDSEEADSEFDVGLAGGAEFADGIEGNQTAGTLASAESLDNVRKVVAANQITLMPNNGNAMNAGTVQVEAAWIELDSLGAAA
jgi:hypothetical protein